MENQKAGSPLSYSTLLMQYSHPRFCPSPSSHPDAETQAPSSAPVTRRHRKNPPSNTFRKGGHWREWCLARNLVKQTHWEFHSQSSGEGQEMDNGIGRSADRHVDGDCVFRGLTSQKFRRAQILSHHVHNPRTALLGDNIPPGIRGRDACTAGESHP